MPTVVAEDDRLGPVAHERREARHVAFHRLGRAEREGDHLLALTPLRDDLECGERLEGGERRVWRLQEFGAGSRVLAATAREVEMVFGLGPGALHLRRERDARGDHDE